MRPGFMLLYATKREIRDGGVPGTSDRLSHPEMRLRSSLATSGMRRVQPSAGSSAIPATAGCPILHVRPRVPARAGLRREAAPTRGGGSPQPRCEKCLPGYLLLPGAGLLPEAGLPRLRRIGRFSPRSRPPLPDQAALNLHRIIPAPLPGFHPPEEFPYGWQNLLAVGDAGEVPAILQLQKPGSGDLASGVFPGLDRDDRVIYRVDHECRCGDLLDRVPERQGHQLQIAEHAGAPRGGREGGAVKRVQPDHFFPVVFERP